jgi:putative ATP-dependent endonuclease of the OLD family
MKLTEVKLQNFRNYQAEQTILINDMTVIVGRNDAGKSTILEALDIFFNDAAIENDDASVNGDAKDVRITCVFKELPNEIVLDEQHPTTLQNEYLIREDGCLEICRVFNCSSTKGKQSRIFAKAQHPTSDGYSDLLRLKITELKTRARDLGVNLSEVTQTIKTDIRRAIWLNAGDNLVLGSTEVELTIETGKTVWDQILVHLPVYALFKSDRASQDQDEEVQDPMKAAIKEVVRNHESQLNDLVDQVKTELNRVAQRTVEKIREMNPDLASSLNPQVKNKSWDSLFSVSLTGDEGISINKRGSGTRRLVLLNFFRAQAEDTASSRNAGVIYAIEEPETSQHPNHQLILLDAFQGLCDSGKAQIILTTHTPTLARKVNKVYLRFITQENGSPRIMYGHEEATLHAIKETLGILPDHDVKLFVGVEGKWDIEFLRRISKILHLQDDTIPDLGHHETNGKLVFIPLGGSSLELWTSRLAGLNRPEMYITDRDEAPPKQPKYHKYLSKWNARQNCSGVCTNKRELENYLHPDVIRLIAPTFPSVIADFDDVPLMLAETLHRADPKATPWEEVKPDKRKDKASSAKSRLNCECVGAMTTAMLSVSDPNDDIKGWLQAIASHLNN